MATTMLCNGCFDIFHEGHKRFLLAAKWKIGGQENYVVVALNSDESARKLKASRRGSRYPIDNMEARRAKVAQYADRVIYFDSEQELRSLIRELMPCILCKGPDYAGKRVTGDDIAPVIILDTPETDEVKELKRKAYML